MTVLIVEDDQDLRDSLARDLRNSYEVKLAASVDEAEPHLETPCDIVVTDLRMPGRDGLDLLQLVKKMSPQTKTILISAFATAKDYEAALSLGATAVLSKPFTRRDLRSAIQTALESRESFHGTVHAITLIDLLQMFHLGGRSATVHVGGSRSGVIHVSKGQIIHAEVGDTTGADALGELLACKDGYLRTGPLATEVSQSIDRPFHSLLLDLLRVADESSRPDGDFDLSSFGESEVGEAPWAAKEDLHDAERVITAWLLECETARVLPESEALGAIVISERRALKVGRFPARSDWVEPALTLLETARSLVPDTRGSFESVNGSIGVFILWNLDQDALLVLAEPIDTPSALSWFRRRTSLLSRCGVGAQRAGGRHGKDR